MKPRPPEDLDDEALLEWERVCGELEAASKLDATDRALLVVYVKTWQIHAAAMKHVLRFGSVVKHHNGVAGASPHYKVSRETSRELRSLLNDLGLTPAARAKAAGKTEPQEEELPL